MTYIYFQDDTWPWHIVRWDGKGLMEEYRRGQGWVENRECFGILAGVDPYYTRITEEEALRIIQELEQKNL
ncbi:MAG TPA: hypothetical protein GX517_09005 [Alicyclobacillus sp.]|nr:hypothetical protein [Alicyclobacillus sp.]